ncbi:MAG TPA: hypothetical protein VEY08_06560, partial [Chloroflexia bacterium]|nr:hypothetical protein [Chloroflexia bacterium]
MFDETESAGSSVVTLGELRTPSTGTAPDWPGLLQEPGEDDKALVTVLDVERSLLQSLLPDVASLPYMAHVRHGTRDGKAVGEELAIVLGNRLPKRNAHSTVHLVALEGRYTSEGFKWHSEQSRAGRLISLKSWSFTCVDPQQRFSQILKNLDPYFGTLSPRHRATLQLPPRNNPTADSYLAMGYVPLGHTARAGSRTVSWYHGPLVPWESAESITLPVRTADELVRYDPAIGMFDVSYAAAWQLGRLLTLQSKQVSTSLYAWKRNMAQALRSAEQHVQHLPFSPEHAAGDLERTVDAWFDNLHKLKGVPFNYLVPDER